MGEEGERRPTRWVVDLFPMENKGNRAAKPCDMSFQTSWQLAPGALARGFAHPGKAPGGFWLSKLALRACLGTSGTREIRVKFSLF